MGLCWGENDFWWYPPKADRWKKADLPLWDVSEALISQQDTFKACWANVRGGSERLTVTRGYKSGAVCTMQAPCYDNTTWRNYYKPICNKVKTETLRNSRKQMFAHSAYRKQEKVCILVVCWLMRQIYVKLRVPPRGEEAVLSWGFAFQWKTTGAAAVEYL